MTWKAAALEDRRLDGADRASFEHHAARCADCRAELAALKELHSEARALPLTDLSRFEHARERAALLERASGGAARRAPLPLPRAAVLLAVVACVVAISAMVLHRRSSSSTSSTRASIEPTTDLAEAPRYEVIESPRAMLRAHSEGPFVRVDLADGSAAFHVDRLAKDQQFVVSLPDAEIEATGARFQASVTLGRTRGVTVTEGNVVLRRAGEQAITLREGEGWQRADELPAAALAPRSPLAMSSAGSASAESSAAATARSRARPPPAALETPHVAPRTAASSKYDAAISSFVHGSYAKADGELLEFVREFPEDDRCEDAAWLAAVARRRMGDMDGARARARSYLDAYPQGLRRPEAQHILDEAR